MAKTLVDLAPFRGKPIAVRHDDGTMGWAATYGTAGFGGVRVSVFASKNAAQRACVGSDAGTHVLARCVNKEGRERRAEWAIL